MYNKTHHQSASYFFPRSIFQGFTVLDPSESSTHDQNSSHIFFHQAIVIVYRGCIMFISQLMEDVPQSYHLSGQITIIHKAEKFGYIRIIHLRIPMIPVRSRGEITTSYLDFCVSTHIMIEVSHHVTSQLMVQFFPWFPLEANFI